MEIKLNEIYGYWKVISYEGKSYWNCICTSCNKTERSIRKWSLTGSITRSCGCQRVENMKKTNLDKYGTEWVQQSSEVREKSETTCLEKYGVDNYAKTEEKKKKTKETNLKKYGVDHHSKRKKKPVGVPFGTLYGMKKPT